MTFAKTSLRYSPSRTVADVKSWQINDHVKDLNKPLSSIELKSTKINGKNDSNSFLFELEIGNE